MSHQVSEDIVRQADQMTVSLARLLRNGETVFHGVASPIPMIATQLAKRLHAPDLVYLSIAGGVDAAPERFSGSSAHPCLAEGAACQLTLIEIFDLCARGGLDTAFLSGVQIDAHGDINMSVIGDFNRPKVRLPGGAGSAAIMPRARRTLMWRTRHDPRVFVDKLSFKTSGGAVDKVVTPLCIFSKEEGRLKVWRMQLGVEWEYLQKQTGFALEKSDDFGITEAPTEAELETLRALDPDGVRIIEF